MPEQPTHNQAKEPGSNQASASLARPGKVARRMAASHAGSAAASAPAAHKREAGPQDVADTSASATAKQALEAARHAQELGEDISAGAKRLAVKETQLVREAQAQLAPRYLKIDFPLLLWLFVAGSILGLALEGVFHVIVYHELESRAGLVWGPFSPIYGCGAVLLTVMLNRFYYTHDLVIFLISMVLGSALEFGTSWMMETFWHAIAWDYTGTFGSIDGRTNFVFGMMWGVLGLFWVRWIMPTIKWASGHIDAKSLWFKVLTVAMTAFLAVDIAVTVLALHREGQRAVDIPAASPIDEWLDQTFTDEWMQARFANMTVDASVDAESHRAYQEQVAQQNSGFKPLMPHS